MSVTPAGRRLFLAAGISLLLNACAGPAARPPLADVEQAWRVRSAQLETIHAWELQGRVAVRAGNDGGQMSLHWRKLPASQTLDFSGPLGKRLFNLTQDEQGASARDRDGNIRNARDAQALIYDLTGWRIPVTGLHYWLRGLPLPYTAAETQFDDAARLAELAQAGWQVRFLDYMRVGEHDLPRKLALSHSADAGVDADIEVKLVIERWTLP